MRKTDLGFAAALIIMLVLFHSSSQTFAEQDASGLLEKILASHPLHGILAHINFHYADEHIDGKNYIATVQFLIRKLAHFSTYLVMGSGLLIGLKGRQVKFATLIALAIPALYACSDEFHQMLTGGRSPLIQDVILDTCGALVGILITSKIYGIIKK
ncbi:MAG: VanZ family protein [Lactobacillales bacterium]|jgi:VanZ family protein|nr:VanZ family protein [Lactobacillales bacterium]